MSIEQKKYRYSAKCPECEFSAASDHELIMQCDHGVWISPRAVFTGQPSVPVHLLDADGKQK